MPKTTGLFRFFYTSLFTFLSIILFILILLTPGDIIYQSYTNNRVGNIFATTGVYVVTLLLAVLLYASRILTNRSVLAGIPRPWIPVEKPDVEKSVRRLVVAGLARSAIIAQQAKPRDQTGEDTSPLDPALTIPKDAPPPWGKVSHPGWTGPDVLDLPNQEFAPVVSELPHLIEAKAVSLAPLDPRLMTMGTASSSKHVQISPDTVPPDERVVSALQRPRNMCLRDYLNHLGRLGLIDPPHLSEEFIQLYERSRFSAYPLTEAEFREMMGLFAEILRGMRYLDPGIVAELQDEGDYDDDYGYGFDSGASYISGQSSMTRSDMTASNSGASFISGASRERGRRGRYHPSSSASSSSGRSGGFRLGVVGGSGSGSDGQSFRSYIRRDQTPSTRSLRPARSNLSELSGQSVIRRTTSQV